jgi:hypothetical protein
MSRNGQKFFCSTSAVAQKMLYVPPMNIRLLARLALKSSPVALLAVLAFSGSAGAATNEIEGVWSFNGGSVAIQSVPGGNTFQGTVVTETQFVECPHTVGEVMWTGMTEQADGSFSGFHQWFHSGCRLEPQFVGPTAWRVLHNSTGGRYLKVCFSHPADPQPSIAISGAPNSPSEYAAYHVTYGCYESALIEPLPIVSGGGGSGGITFSKTVVLPPATGCVAQRSLKIALKNPKNDPLTEVVIKIGSKKVADIKGVKKIKKGITLKKLPAAGTYKISIVATTILKQRLAGSQTYKACTKGSGKIKLKGKKKK